MVALARALVLTPGLDAAASAARVPMPLAEQVLTSVAQRPGEFRHVAYPTLLRAEAACLALEAFQQAAPERQPDAVAS